MKKGEERIIENIHGKIIEVKKSQDKAKELIRKSGIYTKKGNLKKNYS